MKETKEITLSTGKLIIQEIDVDGVKKVNVYFEGSDYDGAPEMPLLSVTDSGDTVVASVCSYLPSGAYDEACGDIEYELRKSFIG